MCCDHQQSHTTRLHRRQRLCEDMGHQPARQQESHLPAGLPGEKLGPQASSVAVGGRGKQDRHTQGGKGQGGQAQL